jgi:carbon starvation protein
VIKKGYLKWAWIPALPLLWDLTVTLTASWQKIFSGDPRVGYWTQHFRYRDALDAGQTSFGAADNVSEIQAVVRNTFIQGTLSIVFALMVIIVFGAGLIMVVRALRGTGSALTEDEPVPSKLFAPSGLIPTKVEREVQKQWDALPGSHARPHAKSVGTGAH